jgi:hypothetical protein
MCGDVKLKMRATRKFDVQLRQMELRRSTIELRQGPAGELQANWPVPDFHMRDNIHVKYRWTKQTQ